MPYKKYTPPAAIIRRYIMASAKTRHIHTSHAIFAVFITLAALRAMLARYFLLLILR